MSSSIHSQVDFSPWLSKITKRDRVFRMIGKTRATRDMSLSAKKRVALSIMSSPLQKMSIGAKQYSMAIALQNAQKQVKVQPVGFFTVCDGNDGEDEGGVVRRIRWGTVDTQLVSYDIPIEIPDDKDDNKKSMTTERKMKIEQTTEVTKLVKSNLREQYNEKQTTKAMLTA